MAPRGSSSVAKSDLRSYGDTRSITESGTDIGGCNYVRLLEKNLIETKIDLANAKSLECYLKLELSESRSLFKQIQKENEFLREQLESAKAVNSASNCSEIDNAGRRTKEENYSNDTVDERQGQGLRSHTRRLPSCASGIALLSGNFDTSSTSLSTATTATSSTSLRGSTKSRSIYTRRLPSCASGIAFLSGNFDISSTSLSTATSKTSSQASRIPSCASGISLLCGGSNFSPSISALSLSSTLLSRSLTKIAEADCATENDVSSSARRMSSSNYQANEEWGDCVVTESTNSSNSIFGQFLSD